MFLSLVVGFSLTMVITAYLVRARHVVDQPNRRSSHTHPTPKAGGIGFIVSFYLLISVMFLLGKLEGNIFIAFVGTGLPLSISGYYDDKHELKVSVRLIIQFSAIFWGYFWIWHPWDQLLTPHLPMPGWNLHWGFIGFILGYICGVWLTNLYNFMDGIDALAAANAIFILFSVTLMSFLVDQPNTSYLFLSLSVPIFAFLIFNIPPARIFMGDVGSSFIGGMMALMAIYTADIIGYWSWAILLSLFIADGTLTLFARLLRGEKFSKPHREHAFQHLVKRLGSHDKVVILYIKIDLLFILPLAFLAFYFPDKGIYFCIVAWSSCFAFTFLNGAGKSEVSIEQILAKELEEKNKEIAKAKQNYQLKKAKKQKRKLTKSENED